MGRLPHKVIMTFYRVQVPATTANTLRRIGRIASWQPDSYAGKNYSSTGNT